MKSKVLSRSFVMASDIHVISHFRFKAGVCNLDTTIISSFSNLWTFFLFVLASMDTPSGGDNELPAERYDKGFF